MTTANNPKNKQPHGLGNLGQINESQSELMSCEAVQCRDCNEASIAFGTNEEVTYCRVYRQFRAIDFQRKCSNFREA